MAASAFLEASTVKGAGNGEEKKNGDTPGFGNHYVRIKSMWKQTSKPKNYLNLKQAIP